MIWAALVVISVLYAITWYFRIQDYRKKISKITCEPYIPLLGHALQLGVETGDLLHSVERMWNNLGKDKFLLRLGPIDQVILTKPEDIEVILTSNTLLTKNAAYDKVKIWLGQGLLTSDGSTWKVHRKILTPAFHFKIIETYVELYHEDARNFVQDVLKKQNQDLETIHLIGGGLSSSLARTALGVFFASKEDMHAFEKNSQRSSKMITDRMFSFWKSFDFIYNFTKEHKVLQRQIETIHSIVDKTYNKKKEELKDLIEAIATGKTSIEELTTGDEFSKRKLTFIEILLLSKKPNGEPLSAEEINDEVNTFVFAGHETSLSSLCLTLYALAKHPDIQDKVYQEQLEITNGDLTQPITYNDIQNMKYLDRVFKEALRLYPPAPMIGRRITQDTVLKDGTELPNGCSVILSPYLTHRHPNIFKDPMKFDPDRFLVPIPIYSYYPFSAGSRNCIGQRLANTMIKTWLATIVRSCIIRPSKDKDIDLTVELTITSKTGVHLQFEMR